MTPAAELIYADERLAVINKPAGVSLATPRSQPHAAVNRLLAALPPARRSDLEPVVALQLAHRLDVGTSGLVVLARSAEAHRELVAAFSRRAIAKTYLAVVWGRPQRAEGVWSWQLGPDRRDRRRMRVDPSGRPAVTRYRVVGGPRFASLLRLYPETGRTHQLRVHLAHAGHPIVGDDLYGGPRHRGVRDVDMRRALDPGHPLLHAWRLILPSFGDRAAVDVVAPLGVAFSAALEALAIDSPIQR